MNNDNYIDRLLSNSAKLPMHNVLRHIYNIKFLPSFRK